MKCTDELVQQDDGRKIWGHWAKKLNSKKRLHEKKKHAFNVEGVFKV